MTRTDEIEALLQKLWALRPEIRDKLSLTVSISLTALIRESERTKAIFAAELSNYQSVPTATQGMEISHQAQTDNVSTVSSIPESHPDAAWN